jgi:hypothetical protein
MDPHPLQEKHYYIIFYKTLTDTQQLTTIHH